MDKSNYTRQVNLLMDIIAQTIMLVLAFTAGGLFFLLFLGGAWQLVSNYCHMKYYNKTRVRRLYWPIAWLVVGILVLTVVLSFLPNIPTTEYFRELTGWGLYICLYGGLILYPFYFILSITEFINIIRAK